MSPMIKPLDVVIRMALHQARIMAKAEFKRKPNRALAMELFLCGSTAAREYCEAAGVDPDGCGFKLWPYESRLGVDDRHSGPADLAVPVVVADSLDRAAR
jgi:hypothetical protein